MSLMGGHHSLKAVNDVKIPSETLLSFCSACFEKIGLSADDARLTAESLIFANLRGVDSHGVIRMKIYADRIRAGGFKANAKPQIVSEQEGSALLDGGHEMGQVAAMSAMN